MRTIEPSVTSEVIGATLTLFQAAGARLKPIRAMMVPVTAGGMTTSIHFAPATCTTRPTIASRTPTTTMPPRAVDMPLVPITAPMGAMNAKLDPR